MCASSKLKRAGFAAGVKMAIAAVTAAMDCGGDVTVPWVAAGEWAGVGGHGIMSGEVGTEFVGGTRAVWLLGVAAVVVVVIAAVAPMASVAWAAFPLLELELLELELEC